MGPEDEVECAVLLRPKPSQSWEFIHYTKRKSVAWRSAELLRQDEISNGHAKAAAIVVLREDYDNGKLKPLKPPKGFDLSIPVGELPVSPVVAEPVSVRAKVEAVEVPRAEDETKPEGEVMSGLRALLAKEAGEAEATPLEAEPRKPRRQVDGLDL